jgi:hypothetical protein
MGAAAPSEGALYIVNYRPRQIPTTTPQSSSPLSRRAPTTAVFMRFEPWSGTCGGHTDLSDSFIQMDRGNLLPSTYEYGRLTDRNTPSGRCHLSLPELYSRCS